MIETKAGGNDLPGIIGDLKAGHWNGSDCVELEGTIRVTTSQGTDVKVDVYQRRADMVA